MEHIGASALSAKADVASIQAAHATLQNVGLRDTTVSARQRAAPGFTLDRVPRSFC